MTLLKQKMLDTYRFAYTYLVNMLPAEMNEADLGKYFIGDRRDFASVQDIYEQFIYSAQNYQSMPNVIKYDLRCEKIKEILLDFDVNQIQYMDVDELYYKLRTA